MTSRTLVWGRQPMTRPVRATMSAHRAAVDRSARDRPTRTAARHMGRVRKRSMTPLLRSVLSPTAVPIAEVGRVPGRPARRRGRLAATPANAGVVPPAAQSGNHDAAVARAVPRDLARRGTADQRYATRSRANLADQIRKVLGGRAEDDQQLA